MTSHNRDCHHGVITFFAHQKGYGFLAGQDNERRYFHVIDLREHWQPEIGDVVSFLPVAGERGPRAGRLGLVRAVSPGAVTDPQPQYVPAAAACDRERMKNESEHARQTLMAGIAAAEDGRIKKSKSSGRLFMVIVALAWLVFLIKLAPMWVAGVVTVIFGTLGVSRLTATGYPNRWLYHAEYYLLPNSRQQDGEHRCIFCGGRGVFKKGQYASSWAYAYCTKCKESLYME